jgi:hypothetical protein
MTRMLTAVMVLLVAGCATARLEVPAGLDTAPEWRVRGLNGFRFDQRLHFGAYEVDDVSRSWTRTRAGLRDTLLGRKRLEQRYAFRLRTDGGEADYRVRCDNSAREQELQLTRTTSLELESSASLECTLQPADSGGAWTLRIGGPRDGRPRGVLVRDDQRFVVEGEVRTSLGTMAGVAGYLFRADDRVVAAVDVVSGGTVRLLPQVAVSERHVLAAAAAALLLQDRLTTD